MTINRIEVDAPYCFGKDPLVLDDLGLVNFIFAPNGSGKTTISRKLAKQPEDVEERKQWSTAKTSLAIRVFNDKYKQSLMQEHISGIFTMGKESQEVNKEIERLQGKIKEEKEKQEKWRAEIGDKESPAPDSLEGKIQEKQREAAKSVFDRHKKIASESVIQVVFGGYRNNKKKMLDKAIGDINRLVSDENHKIAEHNQLVDHTAEATREVIDDGWSLFLDDSMVCDTLSRFKDNQIAVARRQKEVVRKIEGSKNTKTELKTELDKCRSTVSNTAEVAERINNLLHASGFDRFHLAVVEDDIAGGYQIKRDDDEIAIQTLSEWEKSFICFAYYWESLEGSLDSEKSPEEVIAVIDDPISSLDSDALFIVSHYIRKAASDVVSGRGNIKQLIVLTHNVQFHHEASYCSGKQKVKKRHYYRLQKSTAGITECKDDRNTSQIRNTYQMLWDAVVETARAENESDVLRISITNIVRRIVEGYFSFLGEKGSVLEQQDLSVADQRIMRTFEIWSNAGSHTIADDIDQTMDIGSAKQFLKLFQQYFQKRGHARHFDAMIKKSGGEDLLEGSGLFA